MGIRTYNFRVVVRGRELIRGQRWARGPEHRVLQDHTVLQPQVGWDSGSEGAPPYPQAWKPSHSTGGWSAESSPPWRPGPSPAPRVEGCFPILPTISFFQVARGIGWAPENQGLRSTAAPSGYTSSSIREV